MTKEEQRRAAMTSLNYPPGTRLELISMGNDPDPVPPGTRGTVESVNSFGDIDDVKKINGTISLSDAVKFQKG